MYILVLNAGSSTHKLSLYDVLANRKLWSGLLDWGGAMGADNIDEKLSSLLQTLWSGPTQVIKDKSVIQKIAHRVVHGGSLFQQPTVITSDVKQQIRQLIPLAPLHNPANLEGIEKMEQLFPSLPQIAVFDTAFHCTMPEEIKTYPIPLEWKEEGIQRYGFHGISHQYCSERIQQLLPDQKSLKIINCHLGNGASLCAIHEGKSIDTTMGMTPLEGLMMGTRSGTIDPSILLYWMKEKGFSSQQVEEMLNFQSGLLGISGFSDMRQVVSQKSPQSKLALKMYIHRLRSFIGSMAASLKGVDVLSFTGGIGENSAYIRSEVCQGLSFLGVVIDPSKNETCQPDQEISASSARVKTLVIHTQEEWLIAKMAAQLGRT